MHPTILLGALSLALSAEALLTPRHTIGDCSVQPAGAPGYATTNPDTPSAFLANLIYSNAAKTAVTPSGFTQVFQNQQSAIVNNVGYLSYDQINNYDPGYCAQRCQSSAYPGCTGFDIYFERDPTIDPGVNCTNPASLTYIRCAYYSSASSCIKPSQLTNNGQYCQQFQLVIAGSNGYTLNSACNSQSSSSSVQRTTAASSTVVNVPTTAATPKSSSTILTTILTTTTAMTKSSSTRTTLLTTKTSIPQPVCNACQTGPLTDKNGKQYTVACDTEVFGYDLGPVSATCYSDCFSLCDANSQCNAFAFDPIAQGGPHCWLKQVPSGPNAYATIPYKGIVFANLVPTPLSCPACHPGLFTDKNGKRYTVSCDTNLWGSDLGAVPATCYNQCFDICDRNPQCNAFSYDPTATGGSNCWPKQISSTSGQSYPQTGIVFAQISPSTPSCPSCQNGPFTDTQGKQWTLSCDTDHAWSDLSSASVSCSSDCAKTCSTTAGCTAFAFNTAHNICFLKNPTIPANGLQTSPCPGTILGQLIPSVQTCNSGAFTDLFGKVWKVSCGCDSWGNDVHQVPGSCFSDCFQACDNQPGCTAWTFNLGQCWLKNPTISSSSTLPVFQSSGCTFAEHNACNIPQNVFTLPPLPACNPNLPWPRWDLPSLNLPAWL